MDEKHQEIVETKTQRTFLINKVILGQRLALARCNFSYKFAKEKAWVRFVSNNTGGMKSALGGKTADNLNTMSELKARMQKLETKNNEIAEENEELKKNAGTTLDVIKTCGDLQFEVEQLSDALNLKASEIRKLLQENKRLKS